MIEKIKIKTSYQEILIIILLSIIFSLIYNHFSSKSIPFFISKKNVEYVSDNILFEKKIYDSLVSTNVSTEQMLRLVREKIGVIIDARNLDAYKKGHIPGSINIPYLDVFNYLNQIESLSKDTLIVVYCEGINCELSHHLAEFLKGMNFKYIFNYSEGYEEWNNRNLPVEKTE